MAIAVSAELLERLLSILTVLELFEIGCQYLAENKDAKVPGVMSKFQQG